MKYIIKFHLRLTKNAYPKAVAYVKGFQWDNHRLLPSVDWTPYIHEAIQYADSDAATCIRDIVNRRHTGSEIVRVTDKELFKAKLAER